MGILIVLSFTGFKHGDEGIEFGNGGVDVVLLRLQHGDALAAILQGDGALMTAAVTQII